jgi:hypothetical protein
VGFIHPIINFSGVYELIAGSSVGFVWAVAKGTRKKGGHDQLSISGKSRTTIWSLPEKNTDG